MSITGVKDTEHGEPRLMEDGIASSVCGYVEGTPSHDTLSRFLSNLATVIKQLQKDGQADQKMVITTGKSN